MRDLLPSDEAFTEFLDRVSMSKVRRDNRPKLRGYELRLYNTLRRKKRHAVSSFVPTEEQLRVAMAVIRRERREAA